MRGHGRVRLLYHGSPRCSGCSAVPHCFSSTTSRILAVMFCGARPYGRPHPNSMPFKYRDLTSRAPRMAFLSPALWLVTGETSTTPKPHSQFNVRTLVSLLVQLRVIGQSNNSDLPSMVTRIVMSSPCPVTQLKNVFKRVLRQMGLWFGTSGSELHYCRAHCCAASC
jgi:hypothetical protein